MQKVYSEIINFTNLLLSIVGAVTLKSVEDTGSPKNMKLGRRLGDSMHQQIIL